MCVSFAKRFRSHQDRFDDPVATKKTSDGKQRSIEEKARALHTQREEGAMRGTQGKHSSARATVRFILKVPVPMSIVLQGSRITFVPVFVKKRKTRQ